MTRLNKYMVFNPKEDKPKKFFSDRKKALKVARYMRNKYKTDFLVLKVDYIAQYEPTAEEKLEEIKERIKETCLGCNEICHVCHCTKIYQILEGK